MLSEKDLSTLYQIISNDKQTFENISKNFHQNFAKDKIIIAGATLSFLIKDNILNIHQRIISYYILYDISKKENIELNPYFPIILNILNNTKNIHEQNFLIHFIYNKINYLNLSVEEYLNSNKLDEKLNSLPIQILMNRYKDYLNQENLDVKEDAKIRPIIYDRKTSDIINIDFHSDFNLLKDCERKKEINVNSFIPNYMSYYPFNNSNKFLDSEPIWLIPNLKHNFIFEKNFDINKA